MGLQFISFSSLPLFAPQRRALQNLAHELRSPLSTSNMCLSLMHGEGLSPHESELLSTAKKSLSFVLELAEDIMLFSKLEEKAVVLRKLPISPANMLQTVAEVTDRLSSHKGINLFFHLPSNFPSSVMGDTLRVQQICINLLTNAAKFSPLLSSIHFIASHRVEEDKVEIMLQVKDLGIGMDTSGLSHLFQKFSQVHSGIGQDEVQSKIGGCGLGLFICRELSALMNGSIAATSDGLGKGSTFTAKLVMDVETSTPLDEISSPFQSEIEALLNGQQDPSSSIEICVAHHCPLGQSAIISMLDDICPSVSKKTIKPRTALPVWDPVAGEANFFDTSRTERRPSPCSSPSPSSSPAAASSSSSNSRLVIAIIDEWYLIQHAALHFGMNEWVKGYPSMPESQIVLGIRQAKHSDLHNDAAQIVEKIEHNFFGNVCEEGTKIAYVFVGRRDILPAYYRPSNCTSLAPLPPPPLVARNSPFNQEILIECRAIFSYQLREAVSTHPSLGRCSFLATPLFTSSLKQGLKCALNHLQGTVDVPSPPAPLPQCGFSCPQALVTPVAAKTDSESIAQCPSRIMIVDDNTINLRLLQRVLQANGFNNLETASDGFDAIAKAKEQFFHLIIMDINMPNCNGRDAARAIREMQSKEGTPRSVIIAHSAANIDEEMSVTSTNNNVEVGDTPEHAIESWGFDDWIVKPVKTEMMLSKIRKYL